MLNTLSLSIFILDKPWFPNPANIDEKIFTFLDVPHLIKLLRNHYLDTGLSYNGQIISSRTIADTLQHTTKSDVSITHKISEEHLSVKGSARQKVKLATQLFSNTTANAVKRCYSLGLDVYNAVDTADFFKLVNDWFDIHNSSVKTYCYPGKVSIIYKVLDAFFNIIIIIIKEPFGLSLENQKYILNKMDEVMSTPIIPGHKFLSPFQKGILISNAALIQLHEYVAKYNINYLVTNRLNQDVLEHFFGAMRSKGGLNDHPTPKEFKYRLRKYILGIYKI